MSSLDASSAWTEEEWDPIAVARMKREEMKNKMSKAAKELQRKNEEELQKIEEERKKQEEKKRMEEQKREEQKKAKQQKKAKEAVKPKQEEKISLTYSKKELKRAEELKREKQREKDLKMKKEKEEMEKKAVEETKAVEEKNGVIEEKTEKKRIPPLVWILVISFILFALAIRYFFTFRVLMNVQPANGEQLISIVNDIRSAYGDELVELSELKQEGRAIFKKMYLQVNFKSFAELAQFYTSALYNKLQSFIQSQ